MNLYLKTLLLGILLSLCSGCQTGYFISVSPRAIQPEVTVKLDSLLETEGFNKAPSYSPKILASWQRNEPKTFWWGLPIVHVVAETEPPKVIVYVSQSNGRPGLARGYANHLTKELGDSSPNLIVRLNEYRLGLTW